jgi:hypothetical protein
MNHLQEEGGRRSRFVGDAKPTDTTYDVRKFGKHSACPEKASAMTSYEHPRHQRNTGIKMADILLL